MGEASRGMAAFWQAPLSYFLPKVIGTWPCWYTVDRRCKTPRDCRIAGYCCDCFNPAQSEAVRRARGGPLWVWAIDSPVAAVGLVRGDPADVMVVPL